MTHQQREEQTCKKRRIKEQLAFDLKKGLSCSQLTKNETGPSSIVAQYPRDVAACCRVETIRFLKKKWLKSVETVSILKSVS